MPERDWRGHALDRLVPATVLSGIVIAVVLLAFLVPSKLGYNQTRDAEAAQQAEETSEVCIKLPPAISYCPGPESEARNAEADRSAADLKAQQEMADWAFGVVLISSLGLIASLVGVVLVYATFRKTAEANEIARESAERQLRAYVAIKQIRVVSFEVGKPYEFEFQIINSGQTPARGVVFAGGCIEATDPDTARFRVPESSDTISRSKMDIGADGLVTINIWNDRPLNQAAFDVVKNKKTYLVIGGYLSYRDVFSKRHRLVMRGYLKFAGSGTAFVTATGKNNRSN